MTAAEATARAALVSLLRPLQADAGTDIDSPVLTYLAALALDAAHEGGDAVDALIESLAPYAPAAGAGFAADVTALVARLSSHDLAAAFPESLDGDGDAPVHRPAPALNATAIAFVPGTPIPPPAPPPAGDPFLDSLLADAAADDAAWGDDADFDGWGDGVGGADAGHPPGDDPSDWESAALASLASEFPTYDVSSLLEMLRANGGDACAAADVLSMLEGNDVGDGGGEIGVGIGPVPTAAPPARTDRNFPALSCGPGPGAPPPIPDFLTAIGRHPIAPPGWAARPIPGGVRAPPPGHIWSGGGGGGGGSTPWVDTGAAVSQAYASARSAAGDAARARNACYEQARLAHLAGDGAAAKAFGARGRAYGEEMKRRHGEACGAIYEARNPGGGGGAGGGQAATTLDLHGLHVSEATAILGRDLPRLMATGRVRLIVGTGHHTIGAGTPARLPAAVARYLEDHRYTFRQPVAGCIEVVGRGH